jgi:glycosyltransferase involved in cell wall biosynthesis
MSRIDHLCILTPGFPADVQDDKCMPYLQDYLRAVRAQHPETRISVISFQYPFHRRVYDWEGITVHPLGGRNRRWLKPLTWQRALRTFQALHRAHPVTVLHSFWLQEATRLGQRMSADSGVPLVATIMGQDAFPTNRHLRRLAFTRMQVTALSERSAASYKESTGRAVDAILPFALFAPLAWQEDLAADAPRPVDVIGVGSLIRLKKYDRFLRVIRLLVDQRPALRAVLIGDGPERRRLVAMARVLGIADNVAFLGNLPRAEVFAHMARAKVLLHPSLSEGHGYVFDEALSRGLHIVSNAAGLASALDKWAIHPDAIRQADAVGQFLDHPVDFTPRVLRGAEDCVAGFWGLYVKGLASKV